MIITNRFLNPLPLLGKEKAHVKIMLDISIVNKLRRIE